MRQACNLFILFLFGLFLSACGGGGSLETTTETGSGTTTETNPISFTLTMTDLNGKATNKVAGSSPAKLQAKLLQNKKPSEGIKVVFSLIDSVGVLSPSSALTNADGIAEVNLFAGDKSEVGTVTATVKDVTPQSIDFAVSASAVNVSMTEISVLPKSISPNGTAAISVTMNESKDGTESPLKAAVVVKFSSVCVRQNKATIDTDVTTLNGVATATYKDKGCGVNDTIIVTTTLGSETFTRQSTIDVQPALANSISFIGADPKFIALKGTGGSGRSEVSTVSFMVRDEINLPIANALVSFKLTTDTGGIEMKPAVHQAKSDSKGVVSVKVLAGTVAVPVRIIATLVANPKISTISSELTISTGVADYNSFSLSVSNLNPESLNIDGVEVTVTARLADHYNNPVYDGTTVQFRTEFGAIDSSCLTVNGACEVKWRSQGTRKPDPALRNGDLTRRIGRDACHPAANNPTAENDLSLAGLPCLDSVRLGGGLGPVFGNRVTIMAHVLGEESFVDSNGNGKFDNGEAFTDLSEAFIDDNNDGVFGGLLADGTVIKGAQPPVDNCDPSTNNKCSVIGGDNEEFIDHNGNYEFDQANGQYNGVLCLNEIDESCSKTLVSVYRNITILQANSVLILALIDNKLDASVPSNYNKTIDLRDKVKTIKIYLSDVHNGYPPSGTKISFEAGNGTVVGPSSCVTLSSISFGVATCQVSIKKDDTSDSGPLIVTVTSPSGVISKATITLID